MDGSSIWIQRWTAIKEYTNIIPRSKPIRLIVSGLAGITFGFTCLNFFLSCLPSHVVVTVVFTLFSFLLAVLVGRAASSGYTTLEQMKRGVDMIQLVLESQKQEMRTHSKRLQVHEQRTTHLIKDTKQQNENNEMFYLQQMGILAFCEGLMEQQEIPFPVPSQHHLCKLLQPPSLEQVQGKKSRPHILESTILDKFNTIHLNSNSDHSDESESSSDSNDDISSSNDIRISIPPIRQKQDMPVGGSHSSQTFNSHEEPLYTSGNYQSDVDYSDYRDYSIQLDSPKYVVSSSTYLPASLQSYHRDIH
ncbi:MAG: hypothetical protein Sylvanvirus19_9 [Sylvanvirus sp.]|uniref:Uncharacterized protein n=1 Tax=Sylvanvirus sp. TaxID=2487774 RepID=A0A3G5AIN0_9VIRU|nr:MAG: hypothetical protein Sylvanvirus19_9 [Sylvanvirus sp.]